MPVSNPFISWAEKYVFKQINYCINMNYLSNTHIINDIYLHTTKDDKNKLKKIMLKIIKEKTYEDEKKQFALRKICNEIILTHC